MIHEFLNLEITNDGKLCDLVYKGLQAKIRKNLRHLLKILS